MRYQFTENKPSIEDPGIEKAFREAMKGVLKVVKEVTTYIREDSPGEFILTIMADCSPKGEDSGPKFWQEMPMTRTITEQDIVGLLTGGSLRKQVEQYHRAVTHHGKAQGDKMGDVGHRLGD